MKIALKTIALAGIMIAAASCKKDTKVETNDTTPPAGQLKTFSMSITNSLNSTTTYQPVGILKQHTSGAINISGTEGAGGIVALSVIDSLVVGTYSLNQTGPAIISFSNDAGQTFYRSDSGSIEIVSHDMSADKISGKFSGRIVRDAPNADTMMVSGGEFNVNY